MLLKPLRIARLLARGLVVFNRGFDWPPEYISRGFLIRRSAFAVIALVAFIGRRARFRSLRQASSE